MAATKLFGKDLSEYDDIDVDALLEELNDEEIEELGKELIDPDDSCVPPNQRCWYNTEKAPTGPYNRKALVDFIETQAKEEKDWEEPKPFKKEIRGKVYVPPPKEEIILTDEGTDEVETEWDDVLNSATEEEICDLAAILGFHGMLNQVQYHAAFVENKEKLDSSEIISGFQGVAKHQVFKKVAPEPPNDTNVERTLDLLVTNSPTLLDVNLNNIKSVSLEQLRRFAEGLKTNTNVASFHMANTNATDSIAKVFADSLKKNKTLRVLNMESNYITGDFIVELLQAVGENQTVQELRLSNQRPERLGVTTELKIANIVQYNYGMLKLGLFLDTPVSRVRVSEYLQRNNDALRRSRMGLPEMVKEEPPVKNVRAPKVAASQVEVKSDEESEGEEE